MRSPAYGKVALPYGLALALCLGGLTASPASAQRDTLPPIPKGCGNQTYANVVALDQPWTWNRYGALEPQGMMYALARDVVPTSDADGLPDPGVTYTPNVNLLAGQVKLRVDKRPRPLVLRVNAGDCLLIHFTNLLSATVQSGKDEQPATRGASIHVMGLEAVATIRDMGANVGQNGAAGNGVVASGGQVDYNLYAPVEGTYVFYSFGALAGGEADGGSISAGLFGSVNVEPAGSEWYRSQVTRTDLAYARTDPFAFSTTDAFPVINYNATFPTGHRYAGKPVLRMTAGNEIVYGDLTAIITGPGAGLLTNYLPSTNTYPNRNQPFREFSIIFHDEVGAVQAFPQFNTDEFHFTLHSVRDAFAINYGSGGAGAEILANRLNVGPARNCPECKYEEFFLTSWALGDPAMVVDTPANAPCTRAQLEAGNVGCYSTGVNKATKAFFPDDPSNVYHSYINDHVKFRNTFAGTDDHHIFHLHAHQWLHSPKADLSSYKDSQAIGQGTGWTYEITYGGSGNRNKTVGDSIFHCHFYSHFAQGMWSLWRTHDVLELGTVIDGTGKPAANSRALPDGEIVKGTPIPGLVPLPSLAMAPIPSPVWLDVAGNVAYGNAAANPGFPFFIPGSRGHRPPHPPLDFAPDGVGGYLDGGLPRHIVTGGTAISSMTRFNLDKELTTATVNYLPEAGTAVENVAMNFHAVGGAGHVTKKPDGSGGSFKVNGHPAISGAPFADPCWDDAGAQVTDTRTYKAADIQIDAKLNKAGWHFPQTRMISLWNDVAAYTNQTRPPEPLFFRANSGQCINFWLTNLVPNKYVVDDYQVRTPTDIISQHIHLVKFDVTSSDGGGNGWNYEDGTMAGEEVQERLCAIRRAAGTCGETPVPPPPAHPGPCSFTVQNASCPVPKVHPKFPGTINTDCDEHNDYLGAQTTVQRWWADPITNLDGSKRTLRTIFTHDHFGPSSHQQAGLYAGLIIEPAGTTFSHNESGAPLSVNNGPGIDQDGGPTSWQANVFSSVKANNYREFMLEFADFQPVYNDVDTAGRCPNPNPEIGWINPAAAVNAPGRIEVAINTGAAPPQTWLWDRPVHCPVPDTPGPHAILPAPCPEAVAADDSGMSSVNYRTEPIAMRVNVPGTTLQAGGKAGDLSYAYQTRIDRANPAFNTQPSFYPPLTTGLHPGDPFTPLMRAFEGDQVKIRTLVGAHEHPHAMSIHGLKWLHEPDDPNSGYRNSQNTGISEWFDLEVSRIPSLLDGRSADYLYMPSASTEGQWDGVWGILRIYRNDTAAQPATAKFQLTPLSTANPGARADSTDEILDQITVASAQDDRVPGADVSPDTVVPVSGEAGASSSPAVASSYGADTKATSALVSAPPAPLARTDKIVVTCPAGSVTKARTFDISAVSAAEVLAGDPPPPGLLSPGLVYNSRNPIISDPNGVRPSHQGPLYDPTAILFVYTADLSYVGTPARPRLSQAVRREPLVLRANAGECLKVLLRNQLPEKYKDLPGYSGADPIVDHFNLNHVVPSMEVALHPQLVYYDIQRSDGSNVGLNPAQFGAQSVPVGSFRTYYWYAGDVKGTTSTPIEFGSTGLTSSDPIKHSQKGLMGMLIIEPPGATWAYATDGAGKTTRASATVSHPANGFPQFREHALIFQDDVNLRYASDNAPVENLFEDSDMGNSGQKAINYRAEPLWFRGRWNGIAGWNPQTPTTGNGVAWTTRKFSLFDQIFTNAYIGNVEPETPIFLSNRGETVRVRLVHPSGHLQPHVMELHGHPWPENPYVNSSKSIGNNTTSEWMGSRTGVGPFDHADLLLVNGAGGSNAVSGDYFYRSYPGPRVDAGMWGIFRVLP
jgi:hypothetical protein